MASYTQYYLDAKNTADRIRQQTRAGNYSSTTSARLSEQMSENKGLFPRRSKPKKETSSGGGFAGGFAAAMNKTSSKEDASETSYQDVLTRAIATMRENQPIEETVNGVTFRDVQNSGSGRAPAVDEEPAPTVDRSVYQASAAPPQATRGNRVSVSGDQITDWIVAEARLRNIDPRYALGIWKHEGGLSYQSNVARSGNGTLNGKEASFGPFQLFTGGGLGNEYEQRTGRRLIHDNNPDGILNQIRFALDKAVTQGWKPWYGRKPAGIGVWDGLQNARQVRNWS